MIIQQCTVLLFLCVFDYSYESHREPSRKRFEKFVVGGDFATISNYPHATYLYAYCHTQWTCGGSLLNQWIVITAAHCVFGCKIQEKGHKIGVTAGSADIRGSKGTKRRAEKIVVHSGYAEEGVINDIGLIKVAQFIPLGATRKRVIIRSRFPDDTYGETAGWGIVEEGKPFTSPVLKHVNQKLMTNKMCHGVHSGGFCAGSAKKDADHPSLGDSGSCLVTASHTCIGLVSYRESSSPAVLIYTNVSYYFKWIKTKSEQIVCNG